MLFGVDTKIRDLLHNPRSEALLDEYLPQMKEFLRNPRSGELSLDQLIRYTRQPDASALLTKLEQVLQPLNETECLISPEEEILIGRFRKIREAEATCTPCEKTHHQSAVYPGQPWLDTCGNRIQAHGGAVYYEEGSYYWYGENKEYTDGKNGVWTWGIRAYRSEDLCNWEDLGLIIPPNIEDPNDCMFPAKRIDRPHILRCPQTGKYVCWIKLSGAEAAFSVWEAERLTGPYRCVENIYNPGGYKIGDFDLICDESTGKGYIYFDANHEAMVCMALTEDYLHANEELARSYCGVLPPFTREAPCLFASNGYKYMITSGMTGYVPNRSDCAWASQWDQVFASMGDPHVEDESTASFNSQISKIFPVAGKANRFIAMADRWLPETPIDARTADLFTRVVGSTYSPETYQATDEERQEMYRLNRLETANTNIADYVWLPLEISPPDESHPHGQIRILWKEQWDLSQL